MTKRILILMSLLGSLACLADEAIEQDEDFDSEWACPSGWICEYGTGYRSLYRIVDGRCVRVARRPWKAC